MTNNLGSSKDFCSHCGLQSIILSIPPNDTMVRKICTQCEVIHYENPKVVVGAITTFEDKFLLCKRAIEPQLGLWTYPAGFLENGESVEQGAKREAFEEAQASIEIDHLVGVYSLVAINQVHLIYAARILQPEFGPGVESLEVQLFERDHIPWAQLAFPVIKWSLEAFLNNQKAIKQA